jgi:hypothetical protein
VLELEQELILSLLRNNKMNTMIIYIIGIFVLLLLGIWFLIRITKRKKQRAALRKQIPTEVLEQFNELERRWLDSNKNGNNNPYSVIRQFAKDYRARESIITTARPVGNFTSSIGTATVDKQFEEQRSVQSGINTSPQQNIQGSSNGTQGLKGNSNPNFFSRFKRKSN